MVISHFFSVALSLSMDCRFRRNDIGAGMTHGYVCAKCAMTHVVAYKNCADSEVM
jgi:hypothetical protein